MGGNSIGVEFRITTFGESHGSAIGVIVDGVPPNMHITSEDIQYELDRRRPGQSDITTRRDERDRVEILSGILNGVTLGTPIAMIVYNNDVDSASYEKIKNIFRPGHADYTYTKKYSIRDYRGGGRSSGRETLARVAAGAIAKKILSRKFNIDIIAYVLELGGIRCKKIDINCIDKNIVRAPDMNAAEEMIKKVREVARRGDSLGGIVECQILSVPEGLGEPVFDKLDADLAKAMLSIGGVKGIEFGDGFKLTKIRGSQSNDQMDIKGFISNRAGGILGGISTGENIIFRVAVKPTPSISITQKTIDINNIEQNCVIKGRHDPTICPRIVPVVESMAAIVIIDHVMRNSAIKF